MLRVVFMGTPDFSVPALKAISNTHEVMAVYCQPDRPVGRGLEFKAPPVKQAAQELGIVVYQPEKLSLPGEFEKLKNLNPDVIVVVAYGQILKADILNLPQKGCINIHASLLPRWRGAAPIQTAILAGDRKTGITTMKMVEKLDAGEMYLKQEIQIQETDTAETLHEKLSELGAKLILETLQALENGTLRGTAQNEEEVTYAPKLTKDLEILIPNLTATEIDRRVRALSPWPGTSLFLETPQGIQRLRIKQVGEKQARRVGKSTPSLCESDHRLWLDCREGSIELMRVQWQGKKEVDANAFVNGIRGLKAQGWVFPLKWCDTMSAK